MKNIMLLGFGNVGKALAKELIRFDNISVSGILTTKGLLKIDDNWKNELDDFIKKYPKLNFLNASIEESIEKIFPDLIMITIPPSYYCGEPNLSIYKIILKNNISVITADKTGLSIDFDGIYTYSIIKKLFFGYRATVMAGTPATDVAKGLRGREIKEIKSVLNATSNYVLSKVESGYTLDQAIEEAKSIGLVEPDPNIDLEGYDAAAKLVIILNTLLIKSSLNDVRRTPLRYINENEIRNANKEGKRVKYIASYNGKEMFVKPEVVDKNSVLGMVNGNYNSIVFSVEGESITLSGPAGPSNRTARSMITDLLEFLERFD
ncbi:MAG: hypothetical protein ACP5I6_04330 [Caldisphaera sp.]|jgi:homoserine dehydrogenase|nr:MAG: hypothetical protein C0201_03335 [Caldisphaera sp.]